MLRDWKQQALLLNKLLSFNNILSTETNSPLRGLGGFKKSSTRTEIKFMNKILVEGIKIYAYHGCLIEEGKIGCNYIVDVTMETDFSEAAKTDDLKKTIDYVVVYDIVKQQMAIRSKLIEQVGQRIIDELKKQFASLKKVEVKVSKLNPPMNGNVERVSIIISE